mmetsp:Transcript_15103/g.27690  ORF Transcript_15103/g.27690 Transcript_15103/m.27690 type:complete len:425 (-) Transcript_15103:1347-2621(-)
MAASMTSTLEGQYLLVAGGKEKRGKYKYNPDSHEVCDADDASKIFGTFCFDPVSMSGPPPLAFPPGNAPDPCIRIVDSEIIGEIQKPENSGAYFCLPSQFNGAEYPSERSIVKEIERYKFDNTGGPRGQLAVHPAAGQFVLDNAASDDNPGGINAIDVLVAGTEKFGFRLVNGYLSVPKRRETKDQDAAMEVLMRDAHTLRPLVMKGVPACGLNPGKRAFCKEVHRVNLVYASAVPVQSYMNMADESETPFQVNVAELMAIVQYYGALKCAADDAAAGKIEAMKANPFVEGSADGGGPPPPPGPAEAAPGDGAIGGGAMPPSGGGGADAPAIGGAPTPEGPVKAKVFLMPLGGGVFNNPWESIARCMCVATEMLTAEEKALLDIGVLTWNGNPMESDKMTTLLRKHNKLRAPERAAGTGGAIGA